MALTSEQRKALWDDGAPSRGHRVISARPGTGKTTTLTEYCIDIVSDWHSYYGPWQGMAVVSYTNVAKDELERKIRHRGKANSLLSSPHFVGTIDSFINQHLFLSFGAEWMNYPESRPRLIGDPYLPWRAPFPLKNSKPDDASSPIFFDCYGFNVAGEPVVISDQPRKVNAQVTRRAEQPTLANSGKIRKMKEYVWAQGYALQTDANYIAYSLLSSSETLTRSFIGRFPVLIVDEAQDMTELQHALLDHLQTHGQEHIVLVGDEYQAIYEWNTARPQLFTAKMVTKPWDAKSISETFRCSPAICAALTNMAGDGTILSPTADGNNKHYDEPVQVRTYGADGQQDVRAAINDMASTLSTRTAHDRNSADTKTIAVVARSRDDAARLEACFTGEKIRPTKPISWEAPLTKDYLRVIYHLIKNDWFAAVGAYEALLVNTGQYSSVQAMRASPQIGLGNGHVSLLAYRVGLFDDLRKIATLVSDTAALDIASCASYCDAEVRGISKAQRTAIKRDCLSFAQDAKRDQNRTLSSLFVAKDERTYFRHTTADRVRLTFSTVHGVKGETHDGVIFCTRETVNPCGCKPSSTTKWEKILQHPLAECENKRIAYVALSRAAQMLFILAPAATTDAWKALT